MTAKPIFDHPADKLPDPPLAVMAAATAERKDPKLKHLGGSSSDHFNAGIANGAVAASWIPNEGARSKAIGDVGCALAGINPQDELEGMLAGQLVAANAAAMECFRRAMIPTQTTEGRHENLSQGNKASRTYVTLLEALNRHRGKGQQKITIEHVSVHDGGQAIVGHIQSPGGGDQAQISRQPHAPALSHAPQSLATMWREDADRTAVPIAGDAERPVPNARRQKPRRADR